MRTFSKYLPKYFLLPMLAVLFLGLAPQNAHALSAVAQKVQGDVLVHKVGTDPDTWTAIQADTVLNSGDSIKTRKGSCVLAYSDQATFELQENTSLTVTEKTDSQDIDLAIGKILGKVNHAKVTKPFQVSTPAAVAAVRGTEVDFGFNNEGQMTVDLHNGTIQMVNDQVQLTLSLSGSKQITIKYDKELGTFLVHNDAGSNGPITFSVLGKQYTVNPGQDQTVEITTATGPHGPPGTDTNDPGKDPNDPNDGREPISQT
jgi:hypothetical protein